MALRQPTDKHKGPIRVQTKNQVEEAVRLETLVYNPGQNYLRICTPSCTLSNATTLFQQQLICGTKSPSPQVKVVSYKRLRIRIALEHTTTLLPREEGKGGRGIARVLGKVFWECDIFSTVLSKIVGLELKPAEVTVVHSEWRMKRSQIVDESPKAQNWKTPQIGNNPDKTKQPNLEHFIKFIQPWIQQNTIPLGHDRV